MTRRDDGGLHDDSLELRWTSLDLVGLHGGFVGLRRFGWTSCGFVGLHKLWLDFKAASLDFASFGWTSTALRWNSPGFVGLHQNKKKRTEVHSPF